jgi:probable H4MPT-linked C1 transfer pathway protein
MPSPDDRPAARLCVGWDVGGAHLKGCLVDDGGVRDVAQWPCALWEGLDRLDAAFALARERWPGAWHPDARHAATMTGEMVDLFEHREAGVARLAAHLAEALGPALRLYAGTWGFVAPRDAVAAWPSIASANWRATAAAIASRVPDALLVDIGSTTTDLIAVRRGEVVARGGDDAGRLATGELLYQGVVRTPLCALAPRVPFGGVPVNVMNEWFATTADVYRLTGELDPAHDQARTADGSDKGVDATCRRLARMIGRDGRDRSVAEWLALAHAWRRVQADAVEVEALRVREAAELPADAPVVAAGCGAFLALAVARRLRVPARRFSEVMGVRRAPRDETPRPLAGAFPVDEVPPSADDLLADLVDVCAPAVAVALAADAPAATAPYETIRPAAASSDTGVGAGAGAHVAWS